MHFEQYAAAGAGPGRYEKVRVDPTPQSFTRVLGQEVGKELRTEQARHPDRAIEENARAVGPLFDDPLRLRVRWLRDHARDGPAKNYHQKNGPTALLSATTSYDTTQPVGLVDSHNRLRDNFLEDLTEPRGKRRKPHLKGDEAREAADSLAWTAATSLMYGNDNGLIPHFLLREVLVDAVVGHLAEDVERKKQTQKEEIALSDLPTSTVKMLTWYFQHHPDSTASILGEICLQSRVRLGLGPAQVGELLRLS